MSQRAKHFVQLFGLGIYILLGAFGCAAAAYGFIYGLYDSVLHVRISLAHLGAGGIGTLVCCALYLAHAEHIRKSIIYLRRHGFATPYAAGLAVATVVALVVMIGSVIESDRSNEPASTLMTAPSETAKVSESDRLAQSPKKFSLPAPGDTVEDRVPAEPILPPNVIIHTERPTEPTKPTVLSRTPLPRERPSIGGPALDVIWDGEGWKERKRPRRTRSEHPLDIRPPVQRK